MFINTMLTFPEISIPISSKTCVTMASCSSSSPDSVRISSKVSFTEKDKYQIILRKVRHHFNSGPAKPRYALPLQTVDHNQLASEEAN